MSCSVLGGVGFSGFRFFGCGFGGFGGVFSYLLDRWEVKKTLFFFFPKAQFYVDVIQFT